MVVVAVVIVDIVIVVVVVVVLFVVVVRGLRQENGLERKATRFMQKHLIVTKCYRH